MLLPRTRRWITRLSAVVVLLGFASGLAQAQQFRILNHETMDGPSLTSQAIPGAITQAIGLQVFGRQYDLLLEPNSRLLESLSANSLLALGDFDVYQGELANVPGSWVRVMRIDDELSGVFWDGSELYAFEPSRNVEQHLVAPTTGEDIVIYRASDSLSQFRDFLVYPEPNRSGLQKPAGHETLQGLLQTVVSPTLRVSMSLIADEEFERANGSRSDRRMLEIANIVDGIFLWQVGIKIGVDLIEVFDGGPDPFSRDDPAGLAAELSDYRFNTPAHHQLGLTHLFTGRELQEEPGSNFDIVGTAAIGSVCSREYGVALTQATFSILENALIAAHEIGHNFGAPHDGEAGSPCESAPEMLMAAYLNGSEEFSQCSLDVMAAFVPTFPCLEPLPPSDLILNLNDSPHAVSAGESFSFSVRVDNPGQNPVAGLEVIFNVGALVYEGSRSDPWVCTKTGPTVSCLLNSIPAESREFIVLDLRTPGTDSPTISVELIAESDANTANNSVIVDIPYRPDIDIAIGHGGDGRNLALKNNEVGELIVQVRNRGDETADRTEVLLSNEIGQEFLEVLEVIPESGSCFARAAEDEFRCVVGPVPGNGFTEIRVRVRGDAGDIGGALQAGIYFDGSFFFNGDVLSNDTMYYFVDLHAGIARTETTMTAPEEVEIGQIFVVEGRMTNYGPNDTSDARLVFTIRRSDLLIRAVIPNAGSCTVDPGGSYVECVAPWLAVGATFVVGIQVEAIDTGGSTIRLSGSHYRHDPDGVFKANLRPELMPATGPPQLRHRPRVQLSSAGDFNGNGTTDIGVLRRDPNGSRNWVHLADGISGNRLSRVPFGPELPFAYATMSDMSGDQRREHAVLIEGGSLARVKDATDSELLSRPLFDSSFTPVAFLSVGDPNLDSLPDIGVLGFSDVPSRVQVQVKAAASGALVSRFNFDRNYSPFAAVVTDDIDRSPAREVAVLGIDSTGRVRAQVKDALSGELVNLVYFDRRFTPLKFAALADTSGQLTYLAVLGRNADGVIQAQIKRITDGLLVNIIRFDEEYDPIAFLGFADSNASGSGELAVVGVDSDGRVRAQVKEIENGDSVGTIRFDRTYAPIEAIGVNGAAGTGRNEIVVLGANIYDEHRLQIKDLVTGDPVSTIWLP